MFEIERPDLDRTLLAKGMGVPGYPGQFVGFIREGATGRIGGGRTDADRGTFVIQIFTNPTSTSLAACLTLLSRVASGSPVRRASSR